MAALGFLLALASASGAQPPKAGDEGASAPPDERPGLFRVGSFYLTPYLHIGAIGLDTNVLYTATDRQTDVTASGGPGLEIVRPLGRRSRFRLDGGLDYLYFVKTESQRKLNGYGSALLDLRGFKTQITIEERYERTYARPNYEVNARVEQETEGTRGFLRRTLGERWALALSGNRQRATTESTEYLGTDLGATLTQDRYVAGGELRMALSIKTQLVGGGEQGWYRFPRLGARDGQSTLAYGGFRTDSSALISGQALAGMRWFRLDAGGRRESFYTDVDATWNVSPRTKLGGRYRRDLDYSSFAAAGPTPTNRIESAEVFLDKLLARNVYFRISARASRFLSDGEVTLTTEEGVVSAVRDDEIREASAELGYQFRSRVRIGLMGRYTDRRSPFRTFGVEGLIAGLTVQYTPPQPSFR